MGQRDMQSPAHLNPVQRFLQQLADGIGLVRPLIAYHTGAVDAVLVDHEVALGVLKNTAAQGAGIVFPDMQADIVRRQTVFLQQQLQLPQGFRHLKTVFRWSLDGNAGRVPGTAVGTVVQFVAVFDLAGSADTVTHRRAHSLSVEPKSPQTMFIMFIFIE